MRAYEFITERTASDLGIRELINKADDELSGGAADAITSFIGHEPGKVDRDLDDITSIGFMRSDSLEHGEYAKEIEQAFLPVRQQLKKQLGDTITLYRAQRPVEGGQEARNYLSWTSDNNFVKYHAGVNKTKPLYSEQDILKFEKEFEQNDEVKITGSGYTLKLEHMKIYNQMLGSYQDDLKHNRIDREEYEKKINALPHQTEIIEFDSITIYRGNEDITDTDGVREFVNDINNDRTEDIKTNDKLSQRIIKAEVSFDDIIWVSDRAGQSEFIVKNYSGSSAYIDNNGTHS